MTSLQNLSIRSLLRKLRPRTSRYCVPMHSVEGMRYLVQRERYRADRGGPSFSLLAIRILNNDPEDREVEAMIRWLQLHVRITDDVGELLDGRVGLLLPDTSGAGAAAVADRVRLECDCRDLSCDIEILDYPRTPSPESAEADANGGGVRSQQPVEQTTLMRSLFVRPMPVWKRSIDILGAGSLLALTSPIQLGIAAVIKLTSPGPAFFAQHRSGLGGRPFRIVKFRTMRVGAEQEQVLLRSQNEQDGPAFKMKADPRVTTIGRFLRKTSLDELPQLWNVLRGDMSLVGPRPLPCHETEACETWQRYRLDVTPGITCVWQVYGRGRVSFDDWARMDVEYLRNQSLLHDARLLFMTLPAVLSGRGAA